MNENGTVMREEDVVELLKEQNAVLRDKLEEAYRRYQELEKEAVKFKQEAEELEMELQEADRDHEFLRGKLAVYDRLLSKWLEDVM